MTQITTPISVNLIALDASTTMIGYTVIKDSLFFDIGFIEVPQLSILDKLIWCKENVFDFFKTKYPFIDVMLIEEAFVAMYGTTSNAETISKLSQINIGYQLLGSLLGWKVYTLTPSDCRRLAYPGISFKHVTLDVKEIGVELVKKELDPNLFPMRALTKGKNKGKMVYVDGALDMSDSYILAKGYLNLLKANMNPDQLKQTKIDKKKAKKAKLNKLK